MTRAAGPDVGDAGVAVDLGGDGFKDGLDELPAARGTTGHDRGAFAGAFFTARDAGADVEETFRFEFLRTALGVNEVGVAPVDDEITGIEKRDELVDHGIDGVTVGGIGSGLGLHEHHDLAGSGDALDECLHRGRPVEVFARVVSDKLIRHRGGPVVDGDAEAAALNI